MGAGARAARPRDVLVVEEAGVTGLRQVEWVLSAEHEAGAKVVLVGDPEQLQPIDAASASRPSPNATARPRSRRFPGSEIWQKEAAPHLATGRTGEAINAYNCARMLRAANTRDQARAELVDSSDRVRQAEPDKTSRHPHPINAEVRELNEEARSALRATGDLADYLAFSADRDKRVRARQSIG